MPLANFDGIILRLSGMVLCLTFVCGSASAYSFKTIYSFCTQENCADGNGPEAGLLPGPNGSYYGITDGGGANGAGTIFKLTPNKAGMRWTEKVLYNFCSEDSCADGNAPVGGLIRDMAGNLYGTTVGGGLGGYGEVFELKLASGRPKLKVLFSFCGIFDPCGSEPRAGLTYAGKTTGAAYDGTSPLYGVTQHGNSDEAGVVYELTPSRKGQSWKEQVIYSFCSQANCADGSNPSGELYMNAGGDLYGTADSGGATSGGTIFKLSFNERKQKWKFTVLHAFCGACGEGIGPSGNLVADDRGRFFGTTQLGGAQGEGTVYRLVPKGSHSQLSVLYSFCSKPNCADGQNPYAGLTLGDGGHLFGTTLTAGQFSEYGGTVFDLSGNTATVLYSFCALANCVDGQEPLGTLVRDSSGNLFGITVQGGAGASGAVFELSP